MCLAVPMEIVELTGASTARVAMGESVLDVDVSLIERPQKGEFVIVHAGFAIERLDQDEANERLSLFAELAAAEARQ